MNKNNLLTFEFGQVDTPSFADDTAEGLFGAGTIIQNTLVSVYSFSGLVLLGFLMYGGVKWLTAGGDSKAVESAQTVIKNAVVGLIVLVVAIFVVEIIFTLLGIPGSPFSATIEPLQTN